MNERYEFLAIFEYAEDGINITFPDLEGCLSCAEKDNPKEAFKNAKDVLGLFLWSMENDNKEIPRSTDIRDIALKKNQIITLIEIYMPTVRSKMNNKSTKKTLTIPQWLNDLAEKEQINFSHCLQEALKEKLNMKRIGE